MSDVAHAEVTVPLEAPVPAAPLGSQIPELPEKVPDIPAPKEAKPEAEAPKQTRRESIEKAVKEAEAKAEKLKAETPEAKVARERTEQGKFAPKAPDPAAQAKAKPPEATQPGERKRHDDPPARFNETAKANWANAPEDVRAEVYRMQENLEKGYEKHKESAERYDKIRQYDERARQNGGDVSRVLEDVDRIQTMLRTDPVRGLSELAQVGGFDLHKVAAHIAGMPAPQVNQQYAQAMQAKDRQIAELQGRLNEHSQKEDTARAVAEAQAKYPDLEARLPYIENYIKSGILQGTPAEVLDKAYMLASMIPASSAPPAQPPTTTPVAASPASPNPAGQRSVSGSPSVPPKLVAKGKDGQLSRRDSVKNSLIRAGLMG